MRLVRQSQLHCANNGSRNSFVLVATGGTTGCDGHSGQPGSPQSFFHIARGLRTRRWTTRSLRLGNYERGIGVADSRAIA